MMPNKEGWSPPHTSAQVNCCTNQASVSLHTSASERVSGAGTSSVSKNTTDRVGASASNNQLSMETKMIALAELITSETKLLFSHS